MLAYNGYIEKQILENTTLRGMLFTGERVPAVVTCLELCLEPEEEIGHGAPLDADRFFRIESGEATLVLDTGKGQPMRAGDVVLVPAGAHHNVINTSKTAPLKLSTLYAPPKGRAVRRAIAGRIAFPTTARDSASHQCRRGAGRGDGPHPIVTLMEKKNAIYKSY